MTRPRLILLIRCAVLAGAIWLGAEALLLFVPVALMMPPLFVSASECTACANATPASISITFAGIANGTCSNCNDYNTTYICPRNGICQGGLVFDNGSHCSDPTFNNNVTWQFFTGGADSILGVNLIYGSGTSNTYRFRANLGTTPQTCDGRGTEVATFFSLAEGRPLTTCDVSVATATAVF